MYSKLSDKLMRNELNRRSFLKGVGVGLGALAIAGPLSSFASTNGELEEFYRDIKKRFSGTRLTFIGWSGPPLETMNDQFIGEFEEKTGIDVAMELFKFDIVVEKEKMNAVAGAGHYDVISIPYQHLGFFVENGFILPITEYMENSSLRSPDLNPEDFIEAAWKAASWWKDEVYGFTQNPCTMYLWYRKDLLNNAIEKDRFEREFGYELDVPINWCQFRDIAEFFTRKKGDKLAGEKLDHDVYGTAIQGQRGNALTCEWQNFAWSFGGGLSSGKTYTRESIQANAKENIEALDYYRSLMRYSPPGTLDYSWDGPTTAFQQEKVVGVTVEWNDQAFELEKPDMSRVAGKMGYGSIPMKVAETVQGLKGVSHYGGWSLSIPKTSPHPEAAYLLMQWMSSPDIQKRWGTTGVTPSRKSSYEDPGVQAFPPQVPTLRALEFAHYRPRIPEWGEMEEELRIALSDTLMDNKTAKEALDGLQKKYLEILK